MERLILEGAAVVLQSSVAQGRDVLIADGRIARIVPHGALPMEGERLDASGLTVCPGFIDVHVHGGGGADFTIASPEEIVRGARTHLRHGTTTILPTTLSVPIPMLRKALRSIAAAARLPGGESIHGAHLEGPFLSPAQAGAQNPENLSLPTP